MLIEVVNSNEVKELISLQSETSLRKLRSEGQSHAYSGFNKVTSPNAQMAWRQTRTRL